MKFCRHFKSFMCMYLKNWMNRTLFSTLSQLPLIPNDPYMNNLSDVDSSSNDILRVILYGDKYGCSFVAKLSRKKKFVLKKIIFVFFIWNKIFMGFLKTTYHRPPTNRPPTNRRSTNWPPTKCTDHRLTDHRPIRNMRSRNYVTNFKWFLIKIYEIVLWIQHRECE